MAFSYYPSSVDGHDLVAETLVRSQCAIPTVCRSNKIVYMTTETSRSLMYMYFSAYNPCIKGTRCVTHSSWDTYIGNITKMVFNQTAYIFSNEFCILIMTPMTLFQLSGQIKGQANTYTEQWVKLVPSYSCS